MTDDPTGGTPPAAAPPGAADLRAVAATLLALAGIRDGETVVDVGCGDGLLTHPAAAAACPAGRVYGLDPDPAALRAARARRASDVCWVLADPARLPFATGSVHKVLYAARTGLAPAPAEWARLLVPGGRVVLALWPGGPGGPGDPGDPGDPGGPGGDGGSGDPGGLLRAAGLRVGREGTVPWPLAGDGAGVAYATATTPG